MWGRLMQMAGQAAECVAQAISVNGGGLERTGNKTSEVSKTSEVFP
jgi:hypothetical protein